MKLSLLIIALLLSGCSLHTDYEESQFLKSKYNTQDVTKFKTQEVSRWLVRTSADAILCVELTNDTIISIDKETVIFPATKPVKDY